MDPSRATLQRIADASYQSNPPPDIDGWTLMRATPTLKFYSQGNVIVVGIRGTVPTDLNDLKADGSIALGMLESSQRFKTDLAVLEDVRRANPGKTFVGVGHSLGGAILDAFLKRNLLSKGTSYNPAVSPADFKRDLPNTRIYQQGDPLYELMGKFTTRPEVRPRKSSVLNTLIRKIPYVGTLLSSLLSHQLENFEGGATKRDIVLRKYGLEDRGYSLSELAKKTGVKRRILQEVYNRGIGAYKTNPTSVRMKGTFKKGINAPMSKKLSKEQWAMARVYSFLAGNPKHDTDLRGKGDEEEKVEGRCGYYTLETLKAHGFDKIVIPEGSSGSMDDEVLETAVKDYEIGRVENEEGVFPFSVIKQLLQQMKDQHHSGLLFLRAEENQPDHVVPILFKDGELVFQDGEGDTHTIDVSKRLDKQPWWETRSYDDVYLGVDKLIALSPSLEGKGKLSFEAQLRGIGYNPEQYLRDVRRRAKANGYPPSRLSFANNGVHKLAIENEDGKVIRFGRVGYNDFLIWSHLERKKKVERGTAKAKQDRFVVSHSAMKGNWKANDYSPNNLAIRILW